MANAAPRTTVFKEVRISFESSFSGLTIAVRLPSQGATSSSKNTQSRPQKIDIPAAETDEDFKFRQLAVSSSIYSRKHHTSPRNYLWRILENSKVLTIRAVDLCRQERTADSHLTLRLQFPSAIKPNCVALADPKEYDGLCVFVLTETNQLYTFTLKPEIFRRISPADDTVADWCGIYLSSAFSFKHPFRLVALTAQVLIVSLHDGGLLKLENGLGADASSWKETFYNEGGWTQGLRSLVPWQGNSTVRYGKVNLELSAVVSITSQHTMIDDQPYLFTVSLDHRLRVWNLATGKIAHAVDLLGEERLPNEIGKYTINPTQSQLIKICSENYQRAVIVTHSPIGAGEFKFWSVSAGMDNTVEVLDLFPDNRLIPLCPTNDIWTLHDFSATQSSDIISLWVLWKNNLTYRVMKLDFELDFQGRIELAWNKWTYVNPKAMADISYPFMTTNNPSDCTDEWLQFILYPGRFTIATIETGLSIYHENTGAAQGPSAHRSRTLAERICSAVGVSATFRHDSDSLMDYDHFRRATYEQWRKFHLLLEDIDKWRGEAISLYFDSKDGLPWVLTADGVSAIRECSAIERLWHNTSPSLAGTEEHAAILIKAASAFRESFSDSLLHACKSVLASELLQEPSFTHAERMRSFYNRCNFQGQISDEDWQQLLENVGGDFSNVTSAVYEVLLTAMISPDTADHRIDKQSLAEFGTKTVVRGVQEFVELQQNICFDQLVLLVFLHGEDLQPEDGLQLDTAVIFNQLLIILKRLDFLNWLVGTQISVSSTNSRRSSDSTMGITSSEKKAIEDTKVVTILESCAEHLWGLERSSNMVLALTELLVHICDPDSEYELQPSVIQCFLLTQNRPDLAVEFGRFADHDPFSVYVQGRACIAVNDYSAASMHFKKAAYGLGHPDAKQGVDRHSAGLLDDSEWSSLHAGLPQYYSHILSLFDRVKIYSYVIEFSRLALQFCPAHPESHHKRQHKGVNVALRSDVLSRMFNATIQTCRYELAHSTLVLFTDAALRHSALKTLVLRMCENCCATQLVALPLVGLQDTVDDILAQKASGIVDVTAGIPYHKILYAWRLRYNNFRGAAAIALDRLQKLQRAGENERPAAGSADITDTPVTQAFLMVVNALSCVDPKQAWILSEDPSSSKLGEGKAGKRKVFTLDNARKAYQNELDRLAAIDNGQFALVSNGEDEMDLS